MGVLSSSRQIGKRPPSVLARIALQRGLSTGECLVCHASMRATRRYIHSFLYEGMMSSIARQDFLDGGGFCREHFWQAKRIEEECWADGFGVAILCENLLDTFVKDLEKLAQNRTGLRTRLLKVRRSAKKRETRFLPGIECIACEMARSTEEHYLATLEELLDASDFCERFKRSTGLCIGHIHAALERWTSETAVEIVRRVATNHIRQLINELREFQRKHDYQYKHEPRGSEWSSPERAISFLAGPRAELGRLEELQPTRRPRR